MSQTTKTSGETYTVTYPLPGGTPRHAVKVVGLVEARKVAFEYSMGGCGCPWLRNQCRAVAILNADGSHKEWA
jgi:hypothetical protein